MRALLAVLALCGGMPVVASAPPPAPPSGQTPRQISPAAVALAELVSPDRVIEIELSLTRQGIAAAFAQEFGDDWETDFPGLLDAIWADVEPELRRMSAKSQPILIQRLAALYAARLTESEMAVLTRFYRSPTGQKLLRIMYEEADYAPLIKDMITHEDARVTVQAVRSTQDSGKARMLSQLTEEDKAALAELGLSLPIAKMQSLGAEVQQATADWVNEPDPEMEARMASLMEAAAQRYFEQHPPKD